MQSPVQRVIQIVRRRHMIRPRDVEAQGIPREYLLRLYRKGVLERAARGVYVLAEGRVGERHSLALVAKRVPKAIVCLLSALRFHGVTTQEPHEIWIVLDTKARKPSISWPPTRIVRFSGAALESGVERHRIEGVDVKVYTLAKTIADCFKYRNKIGIDVAVEALREALRDKKAPVDQIYKFARICRVANIIRPYLEAVT